MIIIFQLSLLALVILSFLLVIGVPVVFASPNVWTESKKYILFSVLIWTILVFIVGSLNSFVV